MLRVHSIEHDAIMLLLKPGPRQEFRIPITNHTDNKANCEFKILPGGFNAEMHTFFIMPFRFVIPPRETVRITLTVKYNIQAYMHEEFKKRKEMRKLLNIRLKDTKINMGFPILIKVGPSISAGGKSTSDEVIGFMSGGGSSNSRIKL
jgi:hypothetical protein